MKTLSPEGFNQARLYLKGHARTLDWELFKHHFEDGSSQEVRQALAAYQNEDGGFGNALEPDVRTPSSSALATGIGLSILKELGTPAQDSMVQQAVDYLMQSYHETTRTWRVIPEDSNQHPHAPWWHDENGGLAQLFDEFTVIPRAQLVGLLHHYRALVPGDWLEAVTQDTIGDILSIEPLGSGGGDDLRYAISLAETEALPVDMRGRLVTKVRESAARAVERDPEKWKTYSILPLKLAPHPDSLVADLIWDDLHNNLDYLVETQTPQGFWEPNWSWGEAYPQAWEQARQEWRGELTLRYLESLHAFGRIEA